MGDLGAVRTWLLTALVLLSSACSGNQRPSASEMPIAHAGTATEPPGTPPADSPFGVFHIEPGSQWWTPTRIRWAMAETRELGAAWMRLNLHWIMVERSPGVYDWSRPDQWVQAAEEAGIQVMMGIAGYAPSQPEARPPYADGPEKMGAYERFLRQVVSRYRERVRYWQVENEVTLPRYWAGTPEEFVALMRTAYRAIKEEDRGATVLLAGFPGFAITWVEEARDPSDPRFRLLGSAREQLLRYDFILQQTNGYFDVLDAHLYEAPESTTKKVEWYRERMKAFGYERPIWATELGGPHTGLGGDLRYLRQEPPAEAHPAEVVKRYALAFEAGVEKVFWFNLSQRPAGTAASTLPAPFARMALIQSSETEPGGERRPAFYAYQLLVKKLQGFTAVRRVELGEGVWAFRFAKPGGEVYIVWADAERVVTLPIPSRGAMVTDVSGSTLNVDPTRVTVGVGPLFVEAVP